jgi:hypothetical protein
VRGTVSTVYWTVALLFFAACGTQSTSDSSAPTPTPTATATATSTPTATPTVTPIPATYSVGGTLSGLAAGDTVVLRQSGGDDLRLTSDGEFVFGTKIPDGAAFNVTVYSRPSPNVESCTVSDGSGTIFGGDVTNISIACAPLRMFVTGTGQNGMLGGPTGADETCAEEATGRSLTGSYKALLTDGSTRVACTSDNCASGGVSENAGWVFHPTTTYTRTDGALISSTTSNAIFAFPLTASVGTPSLYVWTGLTETWTSSGNTCLGWVSGGGSVYGAAGMSDRTNSRAIGGLSVSCDQLYRIVCVEQ